MVPLAPPSSSSYNSSQEAATGRKNKRSSYVSTRAESSRRALKNVWDEHEITMDDSSDIKCMKRRDRRAAEQPRGRETDSSEFMERRDRILRKKNRGKRSLEYV